MDVTLLALSVLGAFVAYFLTGGIMFVLLRSLKDEFRKYPAVYRSHDSIMSVMPVGMAAMFIGMVALAVLYALLYKGGANLADGARLGALFGSLTGTSRFALS